MDFGQMYLVVNNVGFGLYRLDDVDYKDGVIILSFTNPSTGIMASTSVAINNKYPELFLVNWSDIEDLVYSAEKFGGGIRIIFHNSELS